jgi:translation initiation factor IF-2
VTDIVVLVVACDDGVMPQTEEAFHHAQAANVPVVVALNKIDRPNAKPERVLQQLSALGLQAEEWGGQTICVRTSALTGQGVSNLVEMLSLQAEIMELKANPNKPAAGTVIEAQRSEGRGIEATLLVQDGTLRRGDHIIAGTTFARIRSIFDDKDKPLDSAGPSTPVKVAGFSDLPEVSARFVAVKDLQTARQTAESLAAKSKVQMQSPRKLVTLETLRSYLDAGETKEIRFIVKADVQGSIEVLTKAIHDVSAKEVSTRILHSGVGAITESDVLLAEASDALVVGFHVVPDERARVLAEDRGVNIRTYQVIYHFIEEVKAALQGMLEPEEREKVIGHAEVRQIFVISRYGTVAGCYMKDGTIQRNSHIRLTRDGVVVHTGRLASLRRVKDDVREVHAGLECGLKIEGYDDVKVGDIVEAFEIEKVARVLSSV